MSVKTVCDAYAKYLLGLTRFDDMTGQVEFREDCCWYSDWNFFAEKIQAEIATGFPVTDEQFQGMVIIAAKKNRYNSALVHMDLKMNQLREEVQQRYHSGDRFLHNFAERYFGGQEHNDTDWANDRMRHWLVSVALRVRHPGYTTLNERPLLLVESYSCILEHFFPSLLNEQFVVSLSVAECLRSDSWVRYASTGAICQINGVEYIENLEDLAHLASVMKRWQDLTEQDGESVLKPRMFSLCGIFTEEQNPHLLPELERYFDVIHAWKEIDFARLQAERDEIWAAANLALD
jgi:hypothetical protein